MDNFRTGKYLYFWKKIDGLDWEHLETFTSISSTNSRLREELDLPPISEKSESTEQFCDITKWS